MDWTKASINMSPILHSKCNKYSLEILTSCTRESYQKYLNAWNDSKCRRTLSVLNKEIHFARWLELRAHYQTNKEFKGRDILRSLDIINNARLALIKASQSNSLFMQNASLNDKSKAANLFDMIDQDFDRMQKVAHWMTRDSSKQYQIVVPPKMHNPTFL
jgi:hypothetical protein